MLEEQLIYYPVQWDEEYKNTGFIELWREKYPQLFEDHLGSKNLGTLDLFAQYALMYLLREAKGINSITWYKLANISKKSINRERTLKYWQIMKEHMGEENFNTLQQSLLDNGFTGFTGEPDLFCWHSQSDDWFFAEAKGNDKLLKSQLRWFEICEKALKKPGIIHVYRLVPK